MATDEEYLDSLLKAVEEEPASDAVPKAKVFTDIKTDFANDESEFKIDDTAMQADLDELLAGFLPQMESEGEEGKSSEEHEIADGFAADFTDSLTLPSMEENGSDIADGLSAGLTDDLTGDFTMPILGEEESNAFTLPSTGDENEEAPLNLEDMDVTQLIDTLSDASEDLTEIGNLLKKADNNEEIETSEQEMLELLGEGEPEKKKRFKKEKKEKRERKPKKEKRERKPKKEKKEPAEKSKEPEKKEKTPGKFKLPFMIGKRKKDLSEQEPVTVPGEFLQETVKDNEILTDLPGDMDALTDFVGDDSALTDLPGDMDALTDLVGENSALTDLPGGMDALTDLPGDMDALTDLVGDNSALTDLPGDMDVLTDIPEDTEAALTDFAEDADAIMAGLAQAENGETGEELPEGAEDIFAALLPEDEENPSEEPQEIAVDANEMNVLLSREKKQKNKKPFFRKIMDSLFPEEEETENAPAKEEGAAPDENTEILMELDAEDKEAANKKGKKEKKKKGKKGKSKAAAEAGADADEEIKEKPKKEKKERKKKEKKEKTAEEAAEPVRKKRVLTKKGLMALIALCATIVAAVVLLSIFIPDFADKKNAREAFYRGDYQTVYDLLCHKNLNNSDRIIFMDAEDCLTLQRKLDSYRVNRRLGEDAKALDALLCGADAYENIIHGSDYRSSDSLHALYQSILDSLYSEYQIDESTAKEINALERLEYSQRIYEILGIGTVAGTEAEEIPEVSMPEDILPEEEGVIELP